MGGVWRIWRQEKKTGGFEKIFSTFVGRSVLIGGALAMFGKNKNQKALIQNSLVASASIEAFLFYWYSTCWLGAYVLQNCYKYTSK